MLPRANRLNLSADLRRVLRRGRRFVLPAASFHLLSAPGQVSRFGLVTPKNVGNAVVRHRVARAIRHSWLPILAAHPIGIELAVRALPGADQLSVADWEAAAQAAITQAGGQ